MSYEKLSSGHKSFLTHLNTITIPKTIFEASRIKEWKEAMKVEMDMGLGGTTSKKEVNGI